MAEPILFGTDLAEKKVLGEYIPQYLDGNDLSPLMGKGESVIELKDAPGKGRGDVIYIPLLDALDVETFKLGSNQVVGTGESLRFYSDKVVIDVVRKATALENVQITAQRTPIDVFGALSPQLMEVFQRRLRNDIIDAAKYPHQDVAFTAPVTQRALFGTDTYPANNNIHTGLAALNKGATPTHKLTVAHIRKLRDRAVIGGATNATAERRIRPTKILTRNGFKSEFFMLLAETRALRMLTQDPEWDKQLNRGVIEGPNQPSLLDGARFKGAIENILIYEVPELARIGYTKVQINGDTTSGNATDVAHSLLCGAQAFSVCLAGNPMFTIQEFDHRRVYELAKTELRGLKMLSFDSKTQTNSTGEPLKVENGIIHSFTALDDSV